MQSRTGSGELELRDHLAVLRRRKASVALVVAAAVGGALLLSFLQTPVYEASAEVLLQRRASERLFAPDADQVQTESQSHVETEIEVMRSASVRRAVTEELGRRVDVTIAPKGETDVVALRARSTDPELAARAADTYARTYIESRRQQRFDDLLAASEQVQGKLREIDRELARLAGPGAPADDRAPLEARRDTYRSQLDQLQLASELTQTGGAQVITDAETPKEPAAPRPVRNAALALVAGLVVGIAIAFLREHLDDSVASKEDLEAAVPGVNVLGVIPSAGGRRKKGRVALASPGDASRMAEAYRSLRTSIRFLGLDRELQVLQVTSALPAEGKTTTTANLGLALARAGTRVAVVDCDLRRPHLHTAFGVPNDVGFTSILLGEVSAGAAGETVRDEPNLFLIPSGPPPPNPSELLSGSRARDVVAALREDFDLVLFDSPPVLPVSDALVLSGLVDGVVVVASARQARAQDVRRSLDLLQQVGAPVVGTLLNRARDELGYDAAYQYGYATPSRGRRAEKARADHRLVASRPV